SLVPPRVWWWALILRNLGEMVATASFVSAFTLSGAPAILQAAPLTVTPGAALFLGDPGDLAAGWASLQRFPSALVFVRCRRQ
ncbi:MAG TPA: hypothetical protein VK973_15195, partial [Arenicellales bacterium]|nr:hypothetical protein [Arenicellales bacterium]